MSTNPPRQDWWSRLANLFGMANGRRADGFARHNHTTIQHRAGTAWIVPAGDSGTVRIATDDELYASANEGY